MFSLTDHPHRRYNPLSDEWVLVSPHRTKRPWQGQVETPAIETRPPHDPQCYLCPGNERVGGVRNPDYAGTFVFDNDFAALLPDVPAGEYIAGRTGEQPLLRAYAEHGICRVVCFSPRHDLTLAMLDAATLRAVVDTWAEQTLDLGGRPEIGYVQVFENRGAMMGASNPHPHGQIWATGSIPLHVSRELGTQAAHFAATGRTLLGDYLELELGLGQRVVCANAHFVALVPFWAVWPFETLIISRRAVPDIPALDDAARDGLADILKQLTTRYDALFNVSFPYSMGFHQRPCDGVDHPEWHLHAHFYPPLLRSATVRKFMVGFELLGEPQRDITPEQAAERLRAQ
ncbi:UDP-glucose--hexose-1-phosphate uridylyltransferase [Oscillochloris sp. ZM17-4]|uniref:UDP-glucose--hexose-1-phosphate uridylyltransferase n=1 Tax=Oscillochloris sp. ZM17-4 TaxID=2866714 RepID=UPI001C739EF4|nr:UDP-glucose--hexose-1-phosphate uridylyltransferase [Oscillochloris sp. ZM17-4]MBX0327992.1 UDP-glucose--hexose-1-phosphate uridylyltransferase [Oscillochloris sp. ZM17-4]